MLSRISSEVRSEGAGFRHQVLKEGRYHDIERVLQRPWGFTSLRKRTALFWITSPIMPCSELLWKTEMTKGTERFQNMIVKMMSLFGAKISGAHELDVRCGISAVGLSKADHGA